MSRTVNRGTCSARPGNDALSLEMYPLYHAFTSASNLHNVMMSVAHDHPDLSRFDGQMMRVLAEDTYSMSAAAQAAEGRVRKDTSLLAPSLKDLNTLYTWPLLQKIAADWAPLVRSNFLNEEGKQLGERQLYTSITDTGMTDELIRSRLAIATDQQRCPTAEVPLTRWPVQGAASAPPTFATPMPLRAPVTLGPRGNAPGLMHRPERLLPGPTATQLCANR